MSDNEIHPFQENRNYNPPARSFEHKEFGVMGVGKFGTPVIGLDDLFDTSQFQELHLEACMGLAQCREYGFGKVIGPYPPSLRNQNEATFPEDMLLNISKYDPDGIHRKNLESMNDWETRYRYVSFAMGAVIPWFFTLYLRDCKNFFKKGTLSETQPEWTPQVKFFPKLKKFLETQLPFESIGINLFLLLFSNGWGTFHLFLKLAAHKDHNINFFLDGWRPSFVMNEKTNEKIFLPKGQHTYFFNNRDYHGVDPEPRFRYTLRVDGTFNKKLQNKLGLEDGYVFHWDYPHGRKLLEEASRL